MQNRNQNQRITSTDFVNAATSGGANNLAIVQQYIATHRIRSNSIHFALISAAKHGHAPIVAELLTLRDIDINAHDKNHDTALMHAIFNRHAQVIAMLLNAPGINIHVIGYHRYSALHTAAYRGDIATVTALLSRITDIKHLTQENFRNHTAEQEAIRMNRLDIAKLIHLRMKQLEQSSIHLEEKHASPQASHAPTFTQRIKKVEEQYRSNNMEYKVDVPDNLTCPISCEIMDDAVTLSSGATCDRNSFRRWLLSRGNPVTVECPITYKPKPIKSSEIDEFSTNIIINNLCEDFVKNEENKVNSLVTAAPQKYQPADEHNDDTSFHVDASNPSFVAPDTQPAKTKIEIAREEARLRLFGHAKNKITPTSTASTNEKNQQDALDLLASRSLAKI